MKRREAVKIISLSTVGLTGAGRGILEAGLPGNAESLNDPAPRTASAAMISVKAQVKTLNGRPVLHLNDRPTFAALNWVAAPRTDGWDSEAQAASSRQTGIHLYAFDVGKGTEWIGPGTTPSRPYDFSTLEARFGRVLEADPEALFHLRVYLEAGHGDWWEAAYPDECEVLSDGRRNGQSFASAVWRRDAEDFLRAYIRALEDAGLAGRVIAYQVGAGHTGEWVKGESSMGAPCGDYSEPMRRRFRQWLKERYRGDDEALRRGWNDPRLSFETAEVPSAEAQLRSRAGTFRDPGLERNVIDYFQCLADLCAEAVIDFCRTVKEATRGEKLAGAFYGYLLDLAWNGGFFRERPDSDYSTYQRSGHLGLRRVLEAPDVDFLVSPYSYGFRGLGGDAPSMLPAESVRLHGKLLLVEDDTRTHIDHDDPNYGRARDLRQSIAILRRNLAQDLTHGEGVWWAASTVDPVKAPAFAALLGRFRELGAFGLTLDLAPSADVAVLLDDESFFYESCRYDLDIPLIFQQRLWGLPRMGAPFDVYLLRDLIEDRIKPYKLYIFLNAFRVDAERRAALKSRLRRDRRVALWIYAPGYVDDKPGLASMSDLTGIGFGLGEQPWGPLIHVTDFDHPITRGLRQDLFWGTNAKLSPIFTVDDPAARILGEVVYSQGNCRPGFAVKGSDEWTSVFSAAPNIPANVLRHIARFAGAHIYEEEGDVLYATPQLLGLHTVAGGARRLKLPRTVEVIYDLFERRVVARQADAFDAVFEPGSTSLYFTGEAGLIADRARAGR